MCYIWQNPSLPQEEISLDILKKLPGGFDNLNLTGGEPTLRNDLLDICDVLYPKAKTLEISSNGLHHEKLYPIIKKYPDIKIRFSLEGPEDINNSIRGEKNGFLTKIEGLKALKVIGGTDLGFAMVVQDENAKELMYVYEIAEKLGVELSTSTLHNGWQFHKSDNYHYSRLKSAKEVEKLITKLLSTSNIKNWFRSYMNLGLIEKILGHKRLHSCVAGDGFIFIDPWSDVWACNVRTDLPMGNIRYQEWEEILSSDTAKASVLKVKSCEQNCWMVTTARTAMRSDINSSLPRIVPLKWVIVNKLRLLLNKSIPFEDYIDYSRIIPSVTASNGYQDMDMKIIKRKSFLNKAHKIIIQKESDTHYNQGEFFNL